MDLNNSSGNRVAAVSRAIKILNCFTPSQPDLSLARLSGMLKMPKSTLLNQLKTLEDDGFIMKSLDGQSYSLGYKLMELGYRAHSSMSVIQVAVPLMEDIMSETGEIIYLTSHLNGMVFYMECSYPNRRNVSYSVTGKTIPMHCTASGKAMMSHMNPAQVAEIVRLHPLRAVTKNTITDYGQLLEELNRSRLRGYAIDNEEETLGVKCLAMAIRSGNGDVAGALSISGSVISIRDENISFYVEKLARACNSLSAYASEFPAMKVKRD